MKLVKVLATVVLVVPLLFGGCGAAPVVVAPDDDPIGGDGAPFVPAGPFVGSGSPAGPNCGNGILDAGEACDDGNTNPVGANDYCGTNCKYIEWRGVNFVNQYACANYLGSVNTMYNGYDIANAACAQAASTMAASKYPTGADLYDCTTVNALIHGYLTQTGKTMYTFMDEGTVYTSMCQWIDSSSLGTTCVYDTLTASQLTTKLVPLLRQGPVVLGLSPFKNSSGGFLAAGHYILVKGYDADNGKFAVNDPAGNVDVNWGTSVGGETLGYNLSLMMSGGVTGKILVIRER